MKYHIEGMMCDACTQIIEMDLEERGYGACSVELESEGLMIPEQYSDQMQKIKSIIEKSGKYKVVAQ